MPAFIKTDTHITVVFDSGKNGTMFSSDPSFNNLCTSVKQDDWDEVYDLMFPVEPMKRVISKLSNNRVTIDAGIVTLDGNPMHNTLTDRMLQMFDEGFDIEPMSIFLENMMDNPSFRAVNELYDFLEASNLPITDDGHFLAYKRIGNDYKDIHSHSMDNSPGQIVEMPRNQVNEDKDQTCSTGLHFCAREYLSSYGTGGDSRVVMLKINPRDVVSIPSDYNNAKGRCCRYEVFKEMDINGEQPYRLPKEEIEGVYKTTNPMKDTVEEPIDLTFNAGTDITKDLITSLNESTTPEDLDNAIDLTINTMLAAILPENPLFDELLDKNRNRLIGNNTLLKEEPLPKSSLPETPVSVPTSMAVQKLSTIKSNGQYIALETFMSARDAMKHTGIDSSSIIKVCKGKRNSAGGFKWRWKIVEAPVGWPGNRLGFNCVDIDDASREDEEED